MATRLDTCSMCTYCNKKDTHLRTFYNGIRNRKGSRATAIIVATTAKELLVIIWYMLTRNELYRYMDKQRYERKLQKLEQR